MAGNCEHTKSTNDLDFMIVGAQKCGTTALTQFLSAHPDICMAEPKEAHLFDSEAYSQAWSRNKVEGFYKPFFSHASNEPLRGEATPVYLFFPEVAQALYRYNPQLKLIVILRDPVDRAVSHYSMEIQRQAESLPLWLAILMEPIRLFRSRGRGKESESRRAHSYVNRGLYSKQLLNVLQYFPLNQLMLLDSKYLAHNHAEVMPQVFKFLCVDDAYKTTPDNVFVGSYKKHTAVRFFLKLLFKKEKTRMAKLLRELGVNVSQFGWL